MTKSQIKAELRRSAMEDADPWDGVGHDAFHAAGQFCWPDSKYIDSLSNNAMRIFFLLVAEAL